MVDACLHRDAARLQRVQAQALACRGPRERPRQGAQRNGVGRYRAAVGRRMLLGDATRRSVPREPVNLPAGFGVGADIAARARHPDGRPCIGTRHACPSSCCAVGSARFRTLANSISCRWLKAGQWQPHSRSTSPSPALRKHGGCRSNVIGLCRMRSAGERQFLVGQAIPIGRPAFHQRQCLDQLDRRTRERPGRSMSPTDQTIRRWHR